MFKNLKEKTLLMKILFFVGVIASVVIFILAILQLTGVWEDAAYLYMPLIGVIMLIQTAEYIKKNKTVAYLSLTVAVFVFAVTFFILLG